MSYLLDTCVISELVARQPRESVSAWVAQLDPDKTYLSVVTLGEIQKGIEKLPACQRKEDLRAWLKDDLLVRFRGRLLPLDTEVMLDWGAMISKLETEGTPMPLIDSLVAATALHHDLVIVTRNEKDFERSGVELVNPWK